MVLAYVKSQWPKLNFALAYFDFGRLTHLGEINEALILPPCVLGRTTEIWSRVP
jgi:hypothetical protein